jgi:ribosomal protein L44E
MLRSDINSAKRLFFDKKAVTSAVDRATRRVLSKFGAFTRRTAKKSIKKARQKKISELTDEERKSWRRRQAIGKRKGFKAKRPLAPSRPGEPSRARTGLIKKHIYFMFDPLKRSVVIGPARLSKSTEAPRVLEYGGTTKTSSGPDTGKRITIDPRPTMQLAYQQEQPKLAQMWKDSVR